MKVTRRKFLVQSGISAALLSTVQARAIEKASQETGIADAFKNDFLIGTAVDTQTLAVGDRRYLDLVAREFNSITAENCQKWEEINPSDDVWEWGTSDKFVEFGVANDMHVLGHALVWHSQIPDSVFKTEAGGLVNKKQLRTKMEKHINSLVGRYKNRINTWDVVNEAVSDDGYDKWRDSHFYNILGEDYMEFAFRVAHAADPNAELLYNDYNMHYPAKRKFLVGVLKDYVDRDVPIHGVGFQAHYGLDEPSIDEIEASIEAFVELGLKIHITELDVDVLPKAFEYMGAEISKDFEYSDELNPYPDGLPQEIEEQLAERYAEIFKLFLKHKDSINRVTLWGTTDQQSWKNNWPVKGRTNYPLLFDRNFKAKPAYKSVVGLKG